LVHEFEGTDLHIFLSKKIKNTWSWEAAGRKVFPPEIPAFQMTTALAQVSLLDLQAAASSQHQD
jgi:hypothetical protein